MKKLLLISIFPALALFGCDNNDPQVQQSIDQAKKSTAQAAADIKDAANVVADSAQETAQETAKTVKGKVDDATDVFDTKVQEMKEKAVAVKDVLSSDSTAALTANHWQLTNAIDAQGKRIDALLVLPDKPVQFDFDHERISISNTCNAMGSPYRIQEQQMTFGAVFATKRMCADEKINNLDKEVSNRLAAPASFALTANELKLTTASGDVLTFTAQPTAETRFGSAGEIVFFEVAAQKQACNHPLIPDKQCLMVREVRYAENGAKSYPSESWEPLYQNIEGYEHEPGIRNVVRVKRFAIANPPADAPNVAYVLDMVIESARE